MSAQAHTSSLPPSSAPAAYRPCRGGAEEPRGHFNLESAVESHQWADLHQAPFQEQQLRKLLPGGGLAVYSLSGTFLTRSAPLPGSTPCVLILGLAFLLHCVKLSRCLRGGRNDDVSRRAALKPVTRQYLPA